MEHLTNEAIMRFVKISDVSADSEETLRRVNRHIMECRECAAKVRAAVSFSDAVSAMSESAFSPAYIAASEYSFDGAEVARAAEELFEKGASYNY